MIEDLVDSNILRDIVNVQADPTLTAKWGQPFNNGENSTTFLVSLNVTDDGFDQNNIAYPDGPKTSLPDTVAVVIHNVAPTIGDVANATINEGELFNVTVGFTDPGFLDTHTAIIEWGDGSITNPASISEIDGNGTINASYLYSSGNWTGKVTVDDGDGGIASDSFTVIVLNSPPEITIETPPPETILFGQDVTINGTINDSGSEFTIDVDWTENDDTPAVDIGDSFSLTYTYDQVSDGKFLLTITVCDNGIPQECTTLTYEVAIEYIFGGFESPLSGAQYEKGRTLPVKVAVLNFNNEPVNTAEVRVFWTNLPAEPINAEGTCDTGYFLNDLTFEASCVDANPTAGTTKKSSDENIATFKQGVYQYQLITETIPLGDVRIITLLDDGTMHSSPPITIK
jgi:hypothetical protein